LSAVAIALGGWILGTARSLKALGGIVQGRRLRI